jgi:Cu(I)/Ag(I) efflux system membrane fusion protein
MTPAPTPANTPPPEPPAGARTMAVVRWLIVALAGALALFALISYAGVRGSGGAAPSAQLYQCPMHPLVIQDHPGQCPICSMSLVPIAHKPAPSSSGTDAQAAPGAPGLTNIELSPERIQLIGMKTAPVQRATLGGELRASGVVVASERGLTQITTRFGGWVEKLMVSASGERVRRGQVLATIYSPDVLKAEQDMLIARGWSERAPAAGEHEGMTHGLGESSRQRLLLLGISAKEIDEVIRTGKPAVDIAIRSPADGYVIGKNIVVGAAIQPGTVLFDVADLTRVWLQADIPERDLGRVAVGQSARLELPSMPGQPVPGTVQFVSPVMDAQSRTLRVRLEFKNRFDKSGPRLRPGMYGTVYLALPPTTGLMVPSEAVVDSGQMHYLFVNRAGGHFEPRRVEIGGHAGDRVEILSGVREGEVVVTTGNFLIDSESRLRAAIEGQAGATPGAQTDACAKQFDARKYPEKVDACRACEVQHRGMGSMVDDCKNAIAKPWQ